MNIYFLILIAILIFVSIVIRLTVAKKEMRYYESRITLNYGMLCVYAVQQIYAELSVNEKKKKAAEMLNELMSEKKMVISPLEMTIIIEGYFGNRTVFYQNINDAELDPDYEKDIALQLSRYYCHPKNHKKERYKKIGKGFPDPVSDETIFFE